MANGAVLKPRGDATAGVQVTGVVKQYQKSGTGSAATTLEVIVPADGSKDGASGTSILGTVPPGQAGIKQVSTVVQRASVVLDSGDSGYVGNSLVAVSGEGVVPTPPTGSTAADGLSQAPERE